MIDTCLENSLSKYYFFIAQTKYVEVLPWVTHETALEESDVEYGGIEIDELESENLESQRVLELNLGTMHFFLKKIN